MSNFLFNSIRVKRPPRNTFNLSHENDLSTDFGKLVPINVKEVLPGDKFTIDTSILVKLAPMVSPAYVRIDAYLHYFFVPNRIIFKEWEDFITNKINPTTQRAYPTIYMDLYNDSNLQTTFSRVGGLPDYLGIPPLPDGADVPEYFVISALPFLAYQKIYSDYYRNEFFEDEILDFESSLIDNYGKISSTIADKITTLRYRNWAKDYFTASLPTTQFGNEMLIPFALPKIISDGFPMSYVADGLPLPQDDLTLLVGDKTATIADATSQTPLEYYGGLQNVVDSDAITINDLRKAIKLQEFNEKTMRGGNRYIEQIYSHFGVRSSDARLQRAQFLGGSKTPILISDIYQNSETTETSPQGNRSGNGSGYSDKCHITFRAEEHGFIIGILSIMPHASYCQGLHRMWTRKEWLDYAFPEFSNLGEQEVKNHEIFLNYEENLYTDDSENNGTFGYLPRYAEYKSALDEVHGDFRTSLQFWHSARIFEELPALNNDFLKFNGGNGVDRIFALQDGSDHFYCQLYNSVFVKRNLSKYGTPTL